MILWFKDDICKYKQYFLYCILFFYLFMYYKHKFNVKGLIICLNRLIRWCY